MRPSPRTLVLLVAVLLPAQAVADPQRVRPLRVRQTQERPEPLSDRLEVMQWRPQTKLEAAVDYVNVQDWKKATLALQHVLVRPDCPILVSRPHATGKKRVWISAHAEALRLLSSLPRKAREYYQDSYGPSAARLLAEARKKPDAARLQDIVRQYLYTDAGPEALEALAHLSFDRGDYDAAGPAYALLMHQQAVARWTPQELYRAALSLRRAGFRAPAAAIEKDLWARIGAGTLRLDAKTYTAAQLRKMLIPAQPEGWPIFRANPARTNTGEAAIPLLRSDWVIASFVGDGAKEAEKIVNQALEKIKKRQQPLLTARFPILATQRGRKPTDVRTVVVFRSYWGIHSIDPKTGRVQWQQPLQWSLQGMIFGEEADPIGSPAPVRWRLIQSWLDAYIKKDHRPGILFENSMIGTLSSDRDFVYAIDDVPVPPMKPDEDGLWGSIPVKLQAALQQNRLIAFSPAKSGKLCWELNGPDEKSDLKGSFFLGPPLPLGGKLYCLTEKKQELRLVCLDPLAKRPGTVYYQPAILWTLPLARTRTALEKDPLRRLWAAPLAYAEGVLVVPTNAGAVFGIDLLTRSIAWVAPYTKPVAAPKAAPTWASQSWHASAPVVCEGRVVLAPPDADRLVCLALDDGAVKWSIPRRKDDLYLAGVFKDRVLVVGRSKTRGLSLRTGKTVWERDTGEPTGQGVAGGGHFYLPVASIGNVQPGLCILDVENGTICAKLAVGGKNTRQPLGNLLFSHDQLFSLTPTALIAYPTLDAALRRLDP